MNSIRKLCTETPALGFTLLEMVIALAIGTIVVLAAIAATEQLSQNSSYAQGLATRNEIINTIKQFAESQVVLTASASMPENAQLKLCLSGGGCQSSVTYPLALYGPNPTSSADQIAGPGQVPGASVPASPRYYDLTGKRCAINSAPSSTCPIQVSATFSAQCPVPIPNSVFPPALCSGPPEYVEINYIVESVPGVNFGTSGISTSLVQSFLGTITLKVN